MTDEIQNPEPADQAEPETGAEPKTEPGVEGASATPVVEETTVSSAPATTSSGQNRNLIIGVVAVGVSLIICICLISGGLAGLGIFGGDDATPTPPPIAATAVPTPEPGEPPEAVIIAPNNVVVGEEFNLDGSKSAGASTIVDYVWDFGDGTGGKGARVKHTYVKAGQYIVMLTVTDKDGLTSSSRYQITAAEEQPPVAVIAAPGTALVGDPVKLDGSTSTATNPIVNYTWDFGDRSQGSGPVVEHVYNKAGSYTVKLIVTDNAGLKGEATWDITISEQQQNPPLAVLAGPTQALVGEDVSFDGSESTPGSSPIVNYAWDFGNGKTSSGRNETKVTTQYTAAGTYQVTLTVTDENGLINSASTSINISASLENTTWSLVPAQPDSPITVEFSRGTLSGESGCNDYTGAYITDAPMANSGNLTVQELTVTRKVCEEDVLARENAYLTSLESVTGFGIAGDTLTLNSPSGVLTYQAVRVQPL